MSQITSAGVLLRESVREGARVVWLLRLRYAGRVYTLASTLQDIAVDGVSTPWAPMLSEVSVTLDASLDGQPAVREAAITIAPGVEDWALLESRGHDLGMATAELALLVEGTDYEDRLVVIDGTVQEPEWGDADEPLTFSLVAAGSEDTSVWPPVEAVIGDSTWPDATSGSVGRTYPWVFGRPGIATDTTGATVYRPGSPAHVVDTTTGKVLIAGHPVRAATVNLWNADAQAYVIVSGGVYSTTTAQASATDFTVTTEADGLGRLVATVAGTVALPTDQEFWVVWSADGGMANELGDGDLDTAGQLLRWWLERASQGVDAGRLAAAAGRLSGYRLAGYVDEPVGVWEWVRQELLPILPVAIVAGPTGLYPVVVDPADTSWNLSLEEGRDYDRESRVQTDDSDIVSRVRLSWAIDAASRTYGRTTVLTGSPDATDPEQVSDAYVTISQTRIGVVEEVLESPWIHDARTAMLVLQQVVRARGYARRSVTITPEPWVAVALEPLAPVLLTDAGLHQDEVLHRVASVSWDGEAATMTLVRIEDPVRERRTP